MEKNLVFQYHVKPAPSVVANIRLLSSQRFIFSKEKIEHSKELVIECVQLRTGKLEETKEILQLQ